MRMFTMPFDVTGEEKLIGGVVSLRQIGYIFAGITMGGLMAALPFLPLAIKVILFVVTVTVSIILGFVKMDDGRPNTKSGISLDKYLILRWQFRHKQREFRLGGKTGD